MVDLKYARKERSRDEKASRAVIAYGKTNGCVLWYDGPAIACEIEEHGLRDLEDLGLDDAPEGKISIWEGTYVWQPGSYEYPLDGSTEPSGKFRDLTEDEWTAIKAGRSPWK